MPQFFKYQGAGNDFILFDARVALPFPLDAQPTIKRLCDRHFGIGADGLMLLRDHSEFDFEMVYYNADGHPSSMCGNGGRCIVAFAKRLGIIGDSCHFLAVDGPHDAAILANGEVSLGMSTVASVEYAGGDFILDTGSPHYIRFQTDIQAASLIPIAHGIRYGQRFKEEGINVNLVDPAGPGQLRIRTYERGVENETLACGTGITAASISQAIKDGYQESGEAFTYYIEAVGGDLSVSGRWLGDHFGHLRLIGPADFVFSGEIAIDPKAI